MTNELTKLGSIKVHRRCPKCFSASLVRSASPDGTLYRFVVRCTMCRWSRSFSNVKVGV